MPNAAKKQFCFSRAAMQLWTISLQVAVVDYDHELGKKEVGNTLMVDSNHNQAIEDSTSINFTWLSEDTLKIDLDEKLRRFTQNKSVNGVTIIYLAR